MSDALRQDPLKVKAFSTHDIVEIDGLALTNSVEIQHFEASKTEFSFCFYQ
ncbi:hypothetical protein [Neorickettsia findlayensis]|uniref:Uncharacterized protein n=1 Tax=Neorickettsia findlayensis TaxID=2686014 RepID=A0A6P1G9G6_9RICK|nr:hypothetical protein [Neorickettsia findlayensis]QHD64962.1 hypothetical protein GP480_00550 [Neorickettsia findlayensis]